MASIRKEFRVSAAPEKGRAALRDFGAIHYKLARGFLDAVMSVGAEAMWTPLQVPTFEERRCG